MFRGSRSVLEMMNDGYKVHASGTTHSHQVLQESFLAAPQLENLQNRDTLINDKKER